MTTNRYLEVIKRFLRAETYFRTTTPTNADQSQRPATEDKPQ